MDKIVDLHLNFYQSLQGEKKWVLDALSEEGISVLTGFIDNVDLVKRFYEACYRSQSSRVVLCGINPGRLGAGKTGVPFIDYKSLSKVVKGVNNNDQELSAQFIYSIIDKFGTNTFFDSFYLTNLSWFGFTKENYNYNYYKLPIELQNEFTSGFIEEMTIVNPKIIIPLSKEVEKSLKKMKKEQLIDAPIGKALAHPYYYSNFPTRYEEGIKRYTNIIQHYIA
ncbi:uracil-DNA glycosylase family protein [Guptibacillus hwajinpoensis]|uniref:uracil-DNA glycosylase family protein n=1 Tax=Guptibacillus hwajinpoensis TaxID=208199 RepID=UPI003736CBFE